MGDYTNARDCEHGRLRGSGRICAAEADYASLLARHNALVEAVKWMLYIDTPENFEGGKHIAARAEVDKLLKEEL